MSLAQPQSQDVETDDRPVRGRPRSAEKTAAVLEAAAELFLEQGYIGTSMDQVARNAGVSKQTVYSHFSSKDQLFSAAVRHKLEDYFPEKAVGKLSTHTVETDLLAVGEAYGELMFNPESIAMFRLLTSAADHSSHLAQLFWDSGPQELLERLIDFLSAWEEKGALAFDDPEWAAMEFVSLIKGGLQFKLAIGLIEPLSAEEIRAHVKRCVTSFLRLYGTS